MDDRASYVTSPATSIGGGIIPGRSPASSLPISSSSGSSEDLISVMQNPTPTSYTSSPRRVAEPLPPCNCLEQHAQLLYLLKNLEQGQRTSSIDVALISVQQALAPWQSLIHCRICPHDDDQSVLLLSVMSIRSILRRLQRLCLDSTHTSSASGYSTPAQQTITSGSTTSFGKVTLGSYEATGDEQKLVTDLLIVRALGKIKFVLLSLKEKLDQPCSHSNGRPSDIQNTNRHHQPSTVNFEMSTEAVQQMLRSLQETLRALGNEVKTKIGAEMENGMATPAYTHRPTL